MQSIIDNLSVTQLKELASIKEQMEVLKKRAEAILRGSPRPAAPAAAPKASTPAPAAQGAKPKRKLSAEVRKRIAATLKKRWAAVKAAGGKSL
jgi:hypothetical protein